MAILGFRILCKTQSSFRLLGVHPQAIAQSHRSVRDLPAILLRQTPFRSVLPYNTKRPLSIASERAAKRLHTAAVQPASPLMRTPRTYYCFMLLYWFVRCIIKKPSGCGFSRGRTDQSFRIFQSAKQETGEPPCFHASFSPMHCSAAADQSYVSMAPRFGKTSEGAPARVFGRFCRRFQILGEVFFH